MKAMDTISVDLVLLCRAFFVLATTAAISVNSISPLRELLVSYGARSLSAAPRKESTQTPNIRSRLSLSDLVVATQVPHSWFIHYYIVSVASSLFWAYQLGTNGAVL